MARGVSRSSLPPTLPKVSFQKIEDEMTTHPGGVHDMQAKTYGYNDFSDFKRPDNYIRHIEPLESDLATQVEYDMDEQDKEWLDGVNEERRKDQLNKVTYETFEIIMDRLEKEWFDLTKNIPKPDSLALPSEDSTCAVCDDSEGENSNAIVFCDGCNLAVHQDCYGVPYIPEGQWLCRKCMLSPENPVSCMLCPNEGGAFKQTFEGEWVHLLCAIWVPETRVMNEVFMEPVTGIERISKQRWKLRCSVCDVREGACIQCAKTSCFTAFHATCARKDKLLLPMKSNHGVEAGKLVAYCERHLPKEQQEIREAALAAEKEADPAAVSSKSARAYAKTYKPGPPLAPAIIVRRIETYIDKIKVRKPAEFVSMMCRYWSLKREIRRGAPLLKRLHLEPWTAANKNQNQSEEEKQIKLEQLRRLRKDLEQIRALAQLTRKRESRKLGQAEILQDILVQSLFHNENELRMAFEQIQGVDRNDYFKNPVTKSEAPDYYDIIKRPMCWSVIDSKLDRHEYWDFQAFKDDIELVINNAILYNKADTKFHKTALRIQTASRSILDRLGKALNVKIPDTLPVEASVDNPEEDVSIPSSKSTDVGDLEPPMPILDLLVSSEAIQDDVNILLQSDPITSLLNYEFAVTKPRPPTPPPPPPAPKPKKERKLRNSKRTGPSADSSGAEGETPSSSASLLSISIPRTTRRAAAAVAAFEAEAEAAGVTQADAMSSPVEDISPASLASSSTKTLDKDPAKKGTFKRGPGKKAPAPATPPHTSEGPRVVEGVDNRDSFAMFETGWILPPDQKRGGRIRLPPPLAVIPPDKGMQPPPKKRAKLASALSTFITAESENQTLMMKTTPDAMDVDVPAASSSSPRKNTPARTLERDIIPPGRIVTTATGKTIIEELDTPAIRREKARRRKLRLAEESSRAPASTSSAGGATKQDKETEMSDLSDLDEGDSRSTRQRKAAFVADPGQENMARSSTVPFEELPMGAAVKPDVVTDKVPRKAQSSTAQRAAETSSAASSKVTTRAAARSSATIVLKEGGILEGGTFVWGKSDSYPWWPGTVFDDDDDRIPGNVLEGWEEEQKQKKVSLSIVQYFDKSKTWAYLPLEKMMLLNEDKDLDQDLIANVSKRQKWSGKQAKYKKLCRDAYRDALHEMERRRAGGK